MKRIALAALASLPALPAMAHDGLHMHPHGFEAAALAGVAAALAVLGMALIRRR